MFITLPELISWTGVTVFELWLHSVAIFFSLIFLAVKLQGAVWVSYWFVFSPLFIASALNIYFLFIVFVRSVIQYKDCKGPVVRFLFNVIRLLLLGGFEILLCYKIEGDFEPGQVAVRSSYGIVFMPVWILLAALCFQTCRLF